MDTARETLAQDFKKRKERNAQFSLRAYAKWLGFSPAQVSQMLSGKRNITLHAAKKIIRRLDLSPSEKKLFVGSFLRDHTKPETMDDKKRERLEDDKFKLISDWYHFAILSLTKIKNSKSDPRWVAQRLGISTEEANLAIQRLVRLGLLKAGPQFKQIGTTLEVSSDVPSDAIRKYHKQNLTLAAERIDLVPVHLREFQSISLPIDPKTLDLFKKHIDQFIDEASTLASSKDPKEIYNLNVQFFPITSN
jgi:uncharacterized protein (TIGR02147 family)